MSTPLLDAPSRIGGLGFRAAGLDDAHLYSELALVHWPDEPRDPAVVRHRWSHPTPGCTRERFIIECAGRPVGFARHVEAGAENDPQRNAELEAFLTPGCASPERLREAFEFLEVRAAEAGAEVFNCTVHEEDRLAAQVLAAMGYQQDRVSRIWELDLVDNADRLAVLGAHADAAMRAQGVTCAAMSADADPDLPAAYYAAWRSAVADVPRTVPFQVPDIDEFSNWMASPDVNPEWIFLARVGDGIVGMSSLLFPPTRGNVWTGFTGVVRSHRGRGIARAVKLAILRQAIDHRVPCVRTDNDGANAPMLHINAQLGYQPLPGLVTFRRA